MSVKTFGKSKVVTQVERRTQGVFDAGSYIAKRCGPLLDKLRDAAYFSRYLVDAGALRWPNGLEISPAKVHELSVVRTAT